MPDAPSVLPADWVSTFLRDPVGDTILMSVDGSVTAVNYDYTVPAGKRFFWHQLDLSIVDGAMEAAGFGALAALTNGIRMLVLDADGNTILDITPDQTIKRTTHFGMYVGPEHGADTLGAGDDALTMHMAVRDGGAVIDLSAGQVIRVIVNDDLQAITEFCMMVQGTLTHA